MELDDLDSVQHWADKLKEELQGSKLKIKLFVCNAGVMHVPFKLTKDKIETHACIVQFSKLCLPILMIFSYNSLNIYIVL